MANRFLNNIRINDAYTFPASDGNDGQVITTDGAGNLAFENVSPDAASVIYRDNFTGDGSTVTFDLQNSITDEDQTQIYIDGVYQEKSTYSISGTTITFTTAPILGHSVEVISISSINTGPTVLYQDNFTGNGNDTAFTLGQIIDNEIKTFIFLNGVYQFKNTYTVDGTTLTFDTAPANGVAIEVVSIASAVQSDSLEAGSVIIPVKNTHTASISKGTPVYITGNVGASERLQIAPADASNSAKMPAAGLLLTTLAVNEEGYVITGGYLRNLTTDTIDSTSTSSNDTVYVKAGGGLTMTKPTGSNLIQNIAKVARSASGSSGSLLVSSILRTNDVPNITNDYFWLGNSSGVATATSYTSRFDTAFATKNTDDLSEGSTNLYYTDARADARVALIVDSAPATLDTLNELAAALGDDANFSTTVTNSIATKMPLAGGTFTGAVVGTSFSAPSGFINGSNGGIRIHSSGTKFFNITAANAARDNIMDIGASDARFKDLYLGGNIQAAGNVGIGTSSPSYKLEVNGGTALVGGGFYVSSDQAIVTSSTYTFRDGVYINNPNSTSAAVSSNSVMSIGASTGNSVDTSLITTGAVGIGTTSPSQKLHVQNGYLLVDTNSAVGSGIWMPDINGNPSLRIVTDQATGSYTSILNAWGNSSNTGVMLGTVRNDGIAFQVRSGVTLTSGFANDDGSTRFIVKGDGNVGIGTTSPVQKLSVSGGGGVTRVLIENTGNAAAGTGLQFLVKNGGTIVGQSTTRTDNVGNYSIFTGTTTEAERIRITPAGNVGIGMGGPPSKLTVMESTLCTNSGTDGGTSYVPSKPILLVTTDGNGTPSTNYATNSVFTVGIGGGITGGVTTEHLRVNLNGNVGIGTASPSEILHIKGGGSGPEIRLEGTWGSHYIRAYNDNWNFLVGGTVQAINIKNNGNVGIGTTSADAKLDVHGTTGTKNTTTLNSNTTSVYETSLYFTAGVSATSNHYITTTSVFPPMASGGYILVEVAASGYGSAGSNGFVFKYIAGGYGGHYNIPASYHPTEIIADTHTGNCDVAIYYPNSTTIGITVTNNQPTYSITGVMRVKITTTYG
jgi:hypothetical protein